MYYFQCRSKLWLIKCGDYIINVILPIVLNIFNSNIIMIETKIHSNCNQNMNFLHWWTPDGSNSSQNVQFAYNISYGDHRFHILYCNSNPPPKKVKNYKCWRDSTVGNYSLTLPNIDYVIVSLMKRFDNSFIVLCFHGVYCALEFNVFCQFIFYHCCYFSCSPPF